MKHFLGLNNVTETRTRIADYIKTLLEKHIKPKVEQTDEEKAAALISQAQTILGPAWKVVGVEQTEEEKKAGIVQCTVVIPKSSYLVAKMNLTDEEKELFKGFV